MPEYFKSGAAWGEWGAGEMHKLVGYIPQGLGKLSGIWNAPISDYTFKGWEGKNLGHLSLGYLVSAIAGIGVTVAIVFILGRFLAKK